jgi:hypothetical protein
VARNAVEIKADIEARHVEQRGGAMTYPGGYNPSTHQPGVVPPPPQQQWAPQPPPQAYYPRQQPAAPYPYQQQPVQPQYTGAVTVTRPPFPHGKHIRWSVVTIGIWAVTGYPVAYLWHRFGPTKAVSHTRFV